MLFNSLQSDQSKGKPCDHRKPLGHFLGPSLVEATEATAKAARPGLIGCVPQKPSRRHGCCGHRSSGRGDPTGAHLRLQVGQAFEKSFFFFLRVVRSFSWCPGARTPHQPGACTAPEGSASGLSSPNFLGPAAAALIIRPEWQDKYTYPVN